jgi:DNA-binding PadR family transcriptional regulator
MTEAKLTYTSALILCVIQAGCYYGFDIMETTGLPSGTVYPALRRLEEAGLVQSKWEKESKALAEQRPARKYYKLTVSGADTAAAATERYPLLRNMLPDVSEAASSKSPAKPAGKSKGAN